MNENEKDLKAYVTKLNDRNLQKQNGSGFTLYALLAALIVITFFLIEETPKLFLTQNGYGQYLIITMTLNILVFLMVGYSVIETFHDRPEVKSIRSTANIQYDTYTHVPLAFSLTLFLILNFYTAYLLFLQHQRIWYFLIMGGVLLMQFCS